MRLKKGDKVKVMVGKDRGKEGVIGAVIGDKVGIPNINVYKRHSKPRAQGQKGSITEFNRPLNAANVALICSKCKQITRIGYKITNDKKVRICRKCGENL